MSRPVASVPGATPSAEIAHLRHTFAPTLRIFMASVAKMRNLGAKGEGWLPKMRNLGARKWVVVS